MRDITLKKDNMKFNFRVDVIIEDNDKLLFEKREGYDSYMLLGGKVQLNETAKEAIIRELKEKLGYEVRQQELEIVQIAENFFENKDENGNPQDVQQILFIYKVNVDSNCEFAKKEEFKELENTGKTVKWLTKKEVFESNILPEIAKKHIYNSEFSYDIINHKKTKKK